MKKYLVLLTLLLNIGLLYPHCQVPCGIYDDAVRIVTIKEDFATISKAMVEIKTLSAKNDPQSLNQLNRWIVTKEEHATNIQKVVSDYFLTQRVKSKNKNYHRHLRFLHELLVSAMKCKQTVESKNIDDGLKSLDNFVDIYFDEHGLEHLKKMSK
tara:strand:+ start:1784 stop:2248 length:465 start_codon:yes stop_codon:yes gene_type:complete